MPTDPVTGESLPYPGEPGGPPAGAPPDMAGGPPPGPPPGAPPGGPDDAQIAQLEQIAASAPMPEKPYTVKVVESLVGQVNDTVDALGGQDFPDIELDLSAADGKKWNQPLPPALFVPLVALNDALRMVEDGKFFDKYGFDPTELMVDADLRKATAQLKRMEKDKKLAEAMQAPLEGGPEAGGPPPAPAPGEMSEEDQMLAEGLA